jgi:hypothetical protein
MQIKFFQLINASKAFDILNKCEMNYKLKRILQNTKYSMQKELEWYENQRLELNIRYAEKDETGQPIIKDGNFVLENKEEFHKRYMELLNTETDILPLNLNLIEHLNLSGEVWDALELIIQKGE